MPRHTLFQEYHLEIEKDLCFVLMPFAEEFQPIYDDHIKSTVERAGLRCVRADDLFGPRPIIHDIWEYVCKARVVIAELTGRNPNVFYEVGLGHALDKKVILLTQSMDDVPFDLKYLRCVVYRYDPRGIKALERGLAGAIKSVLKESVVAVVVGEDTGELRREKERYQKEAEELRQRLRQTESRLQELEKEAEPLPAPDIGPTKINPLDGAEMVYVPSGKFVMGSSDDDQMADDDEKSQHTVYLDAFWIYKNPVTNAQYRKCVEAGVCDLPHDTTYYDDPAYANHPVVYVDWRRARAYCEWAGGRLPTEAEWEKAARGTEGRIYPWGNGWDASRLNSVEAGPGGTTEVGRYPAGASPYGALDMAGNVWEWTSSLYWDYPYKADDGREDVNASGRRVLRGGSFFYYVRRARCAYRNHYGPGYLYYSYGFRVCVVSPVYL